MLPVYPLNSLICSLRNLREMSTLLNLPILAVFIHVLRNYCCCECGKLVMEGAIDTSYFCFQEAKELWEKIQQRQGLNKWRPDLEEEYEDQEGNIYNKKTYTDLQRQGLI